MSDYSRQRYVLDPDTLKKKSISIVGAGALGSHTALLLAQMGWGGDNQGILKLFDFDVVEEHNLPSQIFEPSHIGRAKVDCTKEIIQRKCGFGITTFNTKVEKLNVDVQSDYIFLLTDTMTSRSQIYDECVKYSFNTKLFIEARMGLNEGRIYTFNPTNKEHERQWKSTLCSDAEAEISPCGTSMSIATMVWLLATISVSKVIHDVCLYRESTGVWNEAIVKLMPECFRYRKFDEQKYHFIPEMGI